MTMPPIPWKPDRKTLAEFSEAAMFALGMVLAPMAVMKGNSRVAAIFWSLAVAARVAGLWRPALLRPIFLVMMLLSWPIGWMVSNLVLAFVYYGVVTPIGLILRWRGRDAMGRKFDRDLGSYWKPTDPRDGVERYFRPF